MDPIIHLVLATLANLYHHQMETICLGTIGLFAVCAIIMVCMMKRAAKNGPEGWEDADGWHEGRPE